MAHPNFNEFKNNRKIVYFLLFFGFVVVLFFFGVSQAQAVTYYINPANGNDANDGKSMVVAWKTITKANAVLVAGDTVYLMDGLYSEQIRPAHSGLAGNLIIYKNYPGHTPTLTGLNWPIWFPVGINYIVVDGINVDGVDRLTTPLNHAAWVQGDYDVIQNCVFKNGNNKADGGVRLLGNYGKLINCTISHFGYYNMGDVWVEGTYNLVEGCRIEDVGHDCINNFGYHNIIRNNDLYNTIYRVADAAHSGGSDARGYLVFEGNRVHGSPIHGMQANSPYGIIRRNSVYNNGQHGLGIYGSPPSMGDPSHLRIYQNTFYNNGGAGIQLNQNGLQPTDIVMQNNIAYKNIGNFPYYYNVDPVNQHEINNFVGDPLFTDESTYNFNLKTGSSCIDKGAWLTTTTSVGSGTNIPVTDAGYFIDGFGIIEGDIIQLQGQANTARITSINYDTNTITIGTSLTWSLGQGIALAYSGSAPDIGAYEYTGVTPPPADTTAPSIPANLSATAVSSSQINLSWIASTDNVGVIGYRIYRGGTQITTSTTNSYQNTGLSASTTYTYTIAAYDAANNISNQSSSASATTQSPADTTPPVISAVSSSITHNSATITWTTNENSDSQVEYGPTTSYGSQTTLDTSVVTSHSVLLSNLNASTIYHYRVKSKDAANNLATSSDYTFTTSAAPTLSVSLTADPASGTAPLNGVDLTAIVTGNVAGTINYTFYCNRTDSGTNITTPYAAKYDGVIQTTITGTDICSYSTAGTYTAKVIVERGSYKAEARITVNVSQQNYSPIGDVDGADKNHITGWAYDQNVGTSPINVHIYIDGAPVANITANLSRTDIIGAGSGVVQDVNHGFDYAFTNLSIGTHTINVYAINTPEGTNPELSGSPKTVTVQPPSDTTSPSIPANLAATVISSSQINLSWTVSTDNVGVIGYRIYRGGTQITTSTTNSFQNTSLSPSTTYTYTVAAYDAAGNVSNQSTSASATTQEKIEKAQKPSKPEKPPKRSLLTSATDNKIYEITDNNTKHWIPDPQVFDSYSLGWESVEVVTNDVLDSYPRAKLLRVEGNDKIYYLTETGQIRHIPSPEIFNSYNNNWEEVITVSQIEIESYQASDLIRLENGTKVYKLEDNKKRWIQSAEAFNRLKYDWNKIAPVNQVELDYYAEGVSIK